MTTGRTKVRRGRRSPIFNTWLAIKSRGPVCERWRDFGNFYADVGTRPSWRHLVWRDDPTGEFGPAMRDGELGQRFDGGDQLRGHDDAA